MKIISKFLKSKLFVFVILGFFVYFIFIAFGGNDSNTKLWVLAKHEVESKLKSPSSAKFPSSKEAQIRDLGDMCIITSYVDAENSFGAKIRNKFTVTFTKDSNGNYITESVYIAE